MQNISTQEVTFVKSTSIWKRLFGTEMLQNTQVLLQVDIIRICKDRNEFTLLTLTYIPI